MNAERRRILAKAAAAVMEYVLLNEREDLCGRVSLHFDLYKDGVAGVSHEIHRSLSKEAIASLTK